MKHGSLTTFLDGERSAADLWREIEEEVQNCHAACEKHGSGAVIISDGPETQVSRKQVLVLIAALAEGKMPMDAASYIADALIMSEDFAWDDNGIADALFRLSDETASLAMGDLEWAKSRLTGSS